ncbi:MAG: DUF3473 domain-containing protein [Gammaproteobacteria bacterium]|nr:DUF3473 domain-containing protein [Gammaproteobacteria bacterium]
MERSQKHAFTVDVEDYFQVTAFENTIARSDWASITPRVERSTNIILDMLGEAGYHGTFFLLGWVGERFPALVRRIADEGHEVASHGFDHTLLGSFSEAQLFEDVSRTKGILEDAGGTAVYGYRAPTFSIINFEGDAHSVLRRAGYIYSSSIYPVAHDNYGAPSAARHPWRHERSGMLEIPMTTLRIFGRNWPASGGGFFRLYPYPLSRWAWRHFAATESLPGIFYIHPWEVDPEQPRVEASSWRTRFRHYLNLRHTRQRLERLLKDFHWGRMDEVFGVASNG